MDGLSYLWKLEHKLMDGQLGDQWINICMSGRFDRFMGEQTDR